MATAYKVLGQSSPAAATPTTIYTVPSATETIISTISIANRSSGPERYRIAVRPDGATLANQHYIVYDTEIYANASAHLTIGITLNASDIITVYSSSGNLSFSLFGSEIS